jgi:predicted permease
MWHRKPATDGLDEDVSDHLEREIEENVARGMSPAEARRQALLKFGNVALVKEDTRAVWMARWLDQARQDLRFALRSLRRSPAFALVSVSILALGVGASTLVFSVTRAVLLQPLPYSHPEQLVLMWGQSSTIFSASVSAADFLDYRAQTKSFAGLSAAQSFTTPMNLTGANEPERVRATLVASNFFDVLQVPLMIGTGFTARHEDEVSPSAAVLSHDLWLRRYSGRRDIVGEAMTLDGRPMTVVGVMPPGNWFPANTDVWVARPFGSEEWRSRSARNLRPIGRLRPQATLREAREDLDLVASRLARDYPDSHEGWRLRLEPLHEALVGPSRWLLAVLAVAVVMLLLIACTNVATLLMTRGTARRRELATRLALGAGRVRLVRLLLTENAALGLAGGALGALLAWGGVRVVRAAELGAVPRLAEATVDTAVLGFALALSMGTVLFFGLLPAVYTARLEDLSVLRPGPVVGRRSAHRATRSLVGAQLAVSLILLIGAGLLARSLAELLSVDPGFNIAGSLTAQLARPSSSDPVARQAFFEEVVDRTSRLPGVEASGLVSELPLAFQFNDRYVRVEGRAPVSPSERTVADFRRISAGYFTAMGIPVRRGRLPTVADVRTSASVAVIDDTLAARLFHGETPLGQHVFVRTGEDETRLEVIGVVGAVLHGALWSDPRPTVYVPDVRTPVSMTLVLRTTGRPADLARPLRETVAGIDPDQPLSSLRTLEDVATTGVAAPGFVVRLVGLFSILGLALAAVGVYGMLSFVTAQRTREVGLRMALGATRRQVLVLVVGDGLRVAAVSIAVGVAGALAVGRLAAGVLFGVSPYDAPTFAVATSLLIGVSLLAGYLPARRASLVDPATAIRDE